MATLTIDLPDELAQQIQGLGIPQKRLETVVARVVQEFLREWDEAASSAEGVEPPATWSDATVFARRVIANNRDLFDELARV